MNPLEIQARARSRRQADAELCYLAMTVLPFSQTNNYYELCLAARR
jgi:hypothetical protein